MPIISDPYNDQRNTLAQSIMRQATPKFLRQLNANPPNAGGALPQQAQQINAQPGVLPGMVPGATGQPQMNPDLSMPPAQPPQQMMPMSPPPQASPMAQPPPMNGGMPPGAGASAGSKGLGAQPPQPAAMKTGM